MRTLLAFEFKKLLSRKAPWVALILGLAFFALNPMSNAFNSVNRDDVRGMKDIYRLYEGQVITEALQARMQQDYDGYVAAHPDSFTPRALEGMDDESGQPATMYWPNEAATGYDTSVWVAYGDLTGAMSLEDMQEVMRHDKAVLAFGMDSQGKPLTWFYRYDLEQSINAGVVVPVVHYVKGWEGFFRDEPLPGLLAMVVIFLALLGLFNGEFSARLDAVLLCTKERRRAVWAKLAAGAVIAAGTVALFFGLQLVRMALLWGLEGAWLPINALSNYVTNIKTPIFVAFALSVLALVLAAGACGAIVAWASAQFRHALWALLAGGAILVGMVVLWKQDAVLFGTESLLAYGVNQVLYALPVNTLMDTYFMPERVGQGLILAFLLVLPVGLMVLFCWLSHRAFLRRRKA